MRPREDSPERLDATYGSERLGFESLRARSEAEKQIDPERFTPGLLLLTPSKHKVPPQVQSPMTCGFAIRGLRTCGPAHRGPALWEPD